MIKHGFRQLAANRVRLLLTSLAIVISVAFTSAAFILTDGYSRSFQAWGAARSGTADVIVSRDTPFDSGLTFTFNPKRIDDAALDVVRGVPGVADARPVLWVDDLVRPTKPNGSPMDDKFTVQTRGWIAGDLMVVTTGSAPRTGEFVVDVDTARTHGYVVGDRYDVSTPVGTVDMTLSGLIRFGDDNATAGQVSMAVSLGDLQSWTEPGFLGINITASSGVDGARLAAAVNDVLPEGLDAQTKAEVDAKNRAFITPIVNIFRGGFLGFASISVFVSAFLIFNTFTVLLSQRTREIGLLRSIGADPKQIRRSMQTEAAALGTIASLLGLVPGIGLAIALGKLMSTDGLPSPDLIVAPRTIAISLAVGIVMTLVATAAPAKRACGLPAIVALRDGYVADPNSSRRRFIVGVAVVVVGVAGAALGLAGVGSIATTAAALGVGAMAIFIGIAMLNPLWMHRATDLLGWPLHRLGGVPGKIARQNIGRNARRSATTAASLMIGLALVSMVLVVGQSAKVTLANGAASAYQSDHVVRSQLGYKYPAEIVANLDALDVVDRAVGLSLDVAEVDGSVQGITIGSQADAVGLFDFEISKGLAFSDTVTDPVVVSAEEASAKSIDLGDTIPITFVTGDQRNLTVIGINDNSTPGGNRYYIDRSTWFESTGQTTVDIIAVQSEPGVNSATFDSAIARFEAANTQVTVQTIDDFVATSGGNIDSVVAGINLLMLLAILISFAGIANTLTLSVLERTKEIGLLRAVGMLPRQLRRMIRYEASLISLFGAAVGATIGVGFGAAAVVALPSRVTDTISIPVVQIIAMMVFASLAGLVAAAVPAWRASKKNPLRLIAG